MTERPDGYLAPVTYLFGGGESEPETPAGRSVSAEPSAEPMAIPEVRAAVDEILSRPTAQTTPAEAPSRTEKRAHNVSIAALARRGVSIAEMRDLLVRRELEPDVVESELERLIDEHLLDDEMLAESIIRTSTERKGMGISAVRSELRRRKIDAVVIEIALESLDGDDEYTRALEVATARARQLSSYDRATAERRLGSYLQRRGYSGSTMSRALRAAIDATQASAGPRFR